MTGISARETARRDQAGALARDFTAAGGLVLIRGHAAPGTPCCWCDCTWALGDPASPHRVPGYACPLLCTRAAVCVITVRWRSGAAGHPLCGRHADSAEEQILRVVAPPGAEIIFAGLDSFG